MEMFDKIQNPKTGKMVKSAGSLGKHIINNPGTHVYNPKTGKNVKVGGKVGKMVMGGYRKTVGGGDGVSPPPLTHQPSETPQPPTQATPTSPGKEEPGEKELIAFLAAYIVKNYKTNVVKAKPLIFDTFIQKINDTIDFRYLTIVGESFNKLDLQEKMQVVKSTVTYLEETCKIKQDTSCNKGSMITANHCNCGDNAAFLKLRTYLKLSNSTLNNSDATNLLNKVKDKIVNISYVKNLYQNIHI